MLVISALASLLFHWGVMQRVTGAFAWVLRRWMGIGGALALGAAVHIFVGMVEAPLLVRPYLARMQRGELFALMTCGMAGVAGTVMVIYAGFLAPADPGRAGQHPDRLGHQHAGGAGGGGADGAVRSRPPRRRRSWCSRDPPIGSLDALVKGTADGIPVLVGIVAMLIVTIALVALVNTALGLLPHLGRRGADVAAHVRLAVPPGDVADRRAMAGSRRGGGADGHQDGAERIRCLPELRDSAGRRVHTRARG